MFTGIDHVRAPAGGRIGLVRCPGTQAPAITVTGGQARLDDDLRNLHTWPADGLVTLLQPFELTLLGVEALGTRARAHGLQWWHLPITDGAAPGADFEALWPEAARALHAILDADGRLVLHCRAGLGRSGCIAARLLIERGQPADQAIRAVRRARHGAIETGEQEDWLRQPRGPAPRR